MDVIGVEAGAEVEVAVAFGAAAPRRGRFGGAGFEREETGEGEGCGFASGEDGGIHE